MQNSDAYCARCRNSFGSELSRCPACGKRTPRGMCILIFGIILSVAFLTAIGVGIFLLIRHERAVHGEQNRSGSYFFRQSFDGRDSYASGRRVFNDPSQWPSRVLPALYSRSSDTGNCKRLAMRDGRDGVCFMRSY